ncbi:Esterase EstB [Gimesia aquarii]|uniref:Esterase EstB n=2 Tax=Gimesia aquarii TaxID=2527964 RepID=A0A517WVU7_9PLAN|nr:Esterase EstB [Gimesia aquarii]
MKTTRCYVPACLLLIFVFLNPQIANSQISLDSTLEPYLSEYDLPAIAAAVVVRGQIVSYGAVGTRKADSDIPVTVNDRFHLGSDTKAMTALLVAMTVEEGKVNWNSTIEEMFPKLADKMDPQVRKVTLKQLLSHTSGMPADNQDFMNLLKESFDQEGNLDDLRYWMVDEWCKRPLVTKSGTKFAYSNMGYTIIGSMLERVSGKTWEELVTERIFEPFGLETAGFGCQSTPGKIDAPLGHSIKDGKAKGYLAGPNGDSPPLVGPAGTVHMSVLDFAQWAGWNAANGMRPPCCLVKPENVAKLHTPVFTVAQRKDAKPGTPPPGKYAMGWGEVEVEWAPYPVIYHGGSNGLNLAHAWLDKKRDIAIVTLTNIGGKKADEALRKLAGELYKSLE